MKNKIYPCIWFNRESKEAAGFYCQVFDDSRILSSDPLVTRIEMSGQKFMFLDGGPEYKPNPSISFFVVYEDKRKLENNWDQLVNGGKVKMPLDSYPWSEKYGWVEDKFGINWQLISGKISDFGQKIIPALMFTKEMVGRAEEAIGNYNEIFKPSSVIDISRYEKGEPDVEGTIKHARFKLMDQTFAAMDSSLAHDFSFNEGISLVVDCKDQEEIDFYWEKLTDGGEESMCGWLKDRYGVSWQVVPEILGELMSDPERAQRVSSVFMKMNKLEIDKLINA